jgi:hypothetical protein
MKKISDLKKGDRILLGYGEQNGDIVSCDTFNKWCRFLLCSSYKAWEGIVESNPRGKDPSVVFLRIFGFEEDLGDTYAFHIIGVQDPATGFFEPIEHTEKQMQLKAQVEAMGM